MNETRLGMTLFWYKPHDFSHANYTHNDDDGNFINKVPILSYWEDYNQINSIQIKSNVGFGERGKPEYSEKNLSE